MKWTVGSTEYVFSEIYRRNLWGDAESVSGPGSNLNSTSEVRRELPALLARLGVRTLLDAPCGDFNWMSQIDLGIDNYIGCDIVSDLILCNQQRYGAGSRAFVKLDITKDTLPPADAVLCRDCLGHLTFCQGLSAISNFKRTGAKYLLITTIPAVKENKDCVKGYWRFLNLELYPFFFPPPMVLIPEGPKVQVDGESSDQCLGLWRLDAIKVK